MDSDFFSGGSVKVDLNSEIDRFGLFVRVGSVTATTVLLYLGWSIWYVRAVSRFKIDEFLPCAENENPMLRGLGPR